MNGLASVLLQRNDSTVLTNILIANSYFYTCKESNEMGRHKAYSKSITAVARKTTAHQARPLHYARCRDKMPPHKMPLGQNAMGKIATMTKCHKRVNIHCLKKTCDHIMDDKLN